MLTKTEQALELFSAKYSCAQSVLMVFAPDFGLDDITAAKIACALGGGISHLGLTCGAVTGAMLVLGLKYGGSPEKKERTYLAVQEFVRHFSEMYGSINCTDLLGYDLSQPSQLQEARENGIFARRCSKYVEDAVRLLEEMLSPTVIDK